MRFRMRATNCRLTADFELERASASTCSPTGSWVRRERRVETPARLVATGDAADGPDQGCPEPAAGGPAFSRCPPARKHPTNTAWAVMTEFFTGVVGLYTIDL